MTVVRVVRVLEFIGERNAVKKQLDYCGVPVNGQKDFGNKVLIKSAIVSGILEDELSEELDGWHYLEDFKDVPEHRSNKLRGYPEEGETVFVYDEDYGQMFDAFWSGKKWVRIDKDDGDFSVVAWRSLYAIPTRYRA